MPMYDYSCDDCGGTFEAIVSSSSSADAVPCPTCGTAHTTRRPISAFAVGSSRSSSPAMAASPCDSCDHPGGPRGCGLN